MEKLKIDLTESEKKYGEYNKDNFYWKYRDYIRGVNIGGIGGVKKTALRFYHYSVDQEEDGVYLTPELLAEEKPKKVKDAKLVGEEMLLSLNRLYKEINYPADNKVNSYRAIAKWCIEWTHPYNIDELMSELMQFNEVVAAAKDEVVPTVEVMVSEKLTMEELLRSKENNTPKPSRAEIIHKEEARIEQMARFRVDDFIYDLAKLCRTFQMHLALKQVMEEGIDDAALKVAREGRYYDGFNFFERFRESGQDIEALGDIYEGLFPDISMKMFFDKKEEKFSLVPVVNSVFDIGWFILAALSGIGGGILNGKNVPKPIKFCKACGTEIVAYGGQKYCTTIECQRKRKSENTRECRARKKSKKK